jgi:TRAP-type C4-dicarboxylate transport system substrate-binding protein
MSATSVKHLKKYLDGLPPDKQEAALAAMKDMVREVEDDWLERDDIPEFVKQKIEAHRDGRLEFFDLVRAIEPYFQQRRQ